MMLLIQRKNSWIGSLALSICLVLLIVLPVFGAQEGNQAEQTTPGATTTQTPGDETSATPTAATEQKAKEEPAATAGEASQTAKQSKAMRDKVLAALMNKEFVYTPDELIDPFISFVVLQTVASETRKGEDEDEGPPKAQLPLTPLQKMAVGQIERGFKAVIWGDMGMRALIEDGSGKGYIVGVGTPLGGNNGLVTDIQNDRLVIQQEVWDANLKQMVPKIVEIKLTKAGEKKP
jgi:Tfp pilus assembly protein PilP